MTFFNCDPFLCFVLYRLHYCGCNPSIGPQGKTDCVLLEPYYSENQYATCLIEPYICGRSKGEHSCKSYSSKFCYYLCMLELNNIDQGESIFIGDLISKIPSGLLSLLLLALLDCGRNWLYGTSDIAFCLDLFL